MRKSTVFISAVLTTFALVMLYRIASAYTENESVKQSSTEVVAAAPATLEPTATELPAPTEVVLSAEEAAKLAAQVVGKTNLLSAETSSFNGVEAYLVTFTNKDVVYVGLDGQILAVELSPVVVNVAPPKKNKNNGGGNQQTVKTRSGGGNHDDDDDHDDHEEDKDDD